MDTSCPYSPYPRSPITGDALLFDVAEFPARKNGVASALPSGPLGPGFAKIAADAVQKLRLGFPNQRSRCWIRRRGGPCGRPRWIRNQLSVLFVGAAISRPQAFPLQGGRTIPPIRGKCPGGTKGVGGPEGPDEGDVLNACTPGKSPWAGLGPAPTAFIGQVSAFLQGRHTGPPGPVGRDACGARPPGRAVPCAAALPARGGGVPAFYARPSAGAVPDFSRRPIHFRRLLCKRDRGIIFFHLRGKFHTPKGYPHFPPSFPQCVMLSATRPHFA